MGLSESQQLQLLDSISDMRPANQGDDEQAANAGTSLYRLLKAETIRAYYTSRPGLKELDYQGNAFHAESPGCPGK
jgi:hypothetical protein